jgi:hypothetical protein
MSNFQQDMCELVELYVLGGLSMQEREAFEKHLLSCEDCLQKMAELRNIVDYFPVAVDSVEVPKGMKQRVLGKVLENEKEVDEIPATGALPSKDITSGSKKQRPQKNQTKWGRYLISGLSAAVLLLGFYSYTLNETIRGLELEFAKRTVPGEGPKRIGDVVTLDPAAENIVASGLASIVIDSQGTHLLVQAEKLPQLQNTEAYQVWLLRDGQPYNAGTFLSNQGKGALYYTFEPKEYDQIAITLEPDTQGDKPRGKMILLAALTTGG